MVIIFDRLHVFHSFRSLLFAPAPLKRLKPPSASALLLVLRHLSETERSRFGSSCVDVFYRLRRILSADSNHPQQQFKSSADVSKDRIRVATNTNNINQILLQETEIRRRVGDESPHTRDDCKTQGCHPAFRTDRNNVAVRLSDSGHKSSSNQTRSK